MKQELQLSYVGLGKCGQLSRQKLNYSQVLHLELRLVAMKSINLKLSDSIKGEP